MTRLWTAILVACMTLSMSVGFAKVQAPPSFTLFESGQVRPLALSPDGRRLYAVNTPDGRLEIFVVTATGLKHQESVSVGLEPVAVAAPSNDEVWVVNHLSDSVSIVDVSRARQGTVVRTLLVGDEPRDIVFGGPRRNLAFVTAAHRGQNRPGDPQLTTPGIGRADVWVYDADTSRMDRSLGGRPATIITLFTDTPRALAVSPDGTRVYAAGFHTGNRTTTVFEELVPDGGVAAGGLPSTRHDAAGEAQPETGLIVQYNGTRWTDELNRSWDDHVRFSLPDKDVFVIDATASPPRAINGAGGVFAGVGTVLFNMAVNPVSGHVYVSNTEAFNLKRFEGLGLRLGPDQSVRGHLHESRITVIDGAQALPRHLNKHIDYRVCCAALPNPENARSLAQPMDMAVTRDGRTLYVAAFGSSKIGIFDTALLETDRFVPDTGDQIQLSGGGPTGLVLDERHRRLYVLTRFNNAVAVVDVARRREIGQAPLYNPEPADIVRGRRFLYDAAHTSSHGDSSCASCHIFGDFDSLAWDLGDPDGSTIANPGPFLLGPTITLPDGTGVTFNPHYRALKGPMTTQSLRGLANHGPMHWRGDRTGGNDEPSAQPDSGTFNEQLAFKKFNPAFVGLVGRHAPLTDAEMQAFTDFILQITYPPNPIRRLDNALTPDEAAGRALYFADVSDNAFNCNGCHVLDPDGNRAFGVAMPGFFGTDGRSSFRPEPQFLKVPHLRNMYQKVGMFGMPAIPSAVPGDNGFTGDQVRGFGFFHDGSVDTLFRFHGANVFIQRPAGTFGPNDPGNPDGFLFLPPTDPRAPVANPIGDRARRQMEQFMLAFDSNLAPIVGQQITLTRDNADVAAARIALLVTRADVGECELVVKGRAGVRELGFLYQGGQYIPNRTRVPRIDGTVLQAAARHTGSALTYTCVPPGAGVRMGLDRDLDGILDGDEGS